MVVTASPSSQHQHCIDEAQTIGESLQLTPLFVECLPEDFLRQAFVDLSEIVTSSLFFFLLPFQCTLLLFGWFCSLPIWVAPPALPCGLALGFLPFFCKTMPSDLPCTIVLDVLKFPAAASRVDISSAIVNRFTAYRFNAVQFVGNLPRVTFSSASDRDAVMRFEYVRLGDVDCVTKDNIFFRPLF